MQQRYLPWAVGGVLVGCMAWLVEAVATCASTGAPVAEAAVCAAAAPLSGFVGSAVAGMCFGLFVRWAFPDVEDGHG